MLAPYSVGNTRGRDIGCQVLKTKQTCLALVKRKPKILIFCLQNPFTFVLTLMNPTKEVYIVRHGQTEFNRQGIIQGRGINSSLNEQGHRQAACFYQAYRHVPFEFLISSTLKRTQQTLQPFMEHGLPSLALPELDEISWGAMEGKTEVHEWDNTFREMTARWAAGELDFSAPGGESPIALQKRQLIMLGILKNIPAQKILIASHGRYIRALMCTITGTSLSRMETFEHTNLCLYKIDLHQDDWKLVLKDERSHLKDLME
jgi:broad specificity phosphatase PhoE